jgi:hypothetical protein
MSRSQFLRRIEGEMAVYLQRLISNINASMSGAFTNNPSTDSHASRFFELQVNRLTRMTVLIGSPLSGAVFTKNRPLGVLFRNGKHTCLCSSNYFLN